METRPGKAYPLGATFDGTGTNFAIYSSVATSVTLCLLDDDLNEMRIPMTEVDAYVWHVYVPQVRAGQLYGYRIDGPWDPQNGLRCDPSKLLLDPYAKAIEGQLKDSLDLLSYQVDDPLTLKGGDSADATMHSVVVNPFFDWEGDHSPGHDYSESIIYEAHIKGMTMRHPDIPEELRGTYAGMAHPAIIEHLTKLGITTVELMPIQQFTNDTTLQAKGLSNYWGYNTIGYFAPHNGYAATKDPGAQVSEFKAMVKALHAANIEVILDVVYNHTAEGNHMGPTLSFRGIDNPSYYRLVDGDRQHYFDTTGTGNSLLMSSPQVLQLIMDSLRYWVTEMHVDGFRFDLASTLARQFAEVDRLSAFFDLIHQDPVVSQVKLIAEPWDVGADGYQVGGFPPLWSEWNGRYRDTVRDFWRGEFSSLPDFASRLAGSSDLYGTTGRKPTASINFVIAHDGFTLRDLVSYNEKHNEANLEGGADGANDNRSWNCGVEGDTDDEDIIELRYRQQRNFLTTLMFSQGVPMIAHGDELGRTQRGNNNVYCQDNELSWINWDLDEHDHKLLHFTRHLIHLRRDHPVMRRRRFLEGPARRGGESELGEIEWFTPAGTHMTEEEWNQPWARSTMVFYNGDAIREPDANGQRILDDDFLLLLNAAPEAVDFTLPDTKYGQIWHTVVDTAGDDDRDEYHSGDIVHVGPRTSFILRNPRGL
ncbi:MAG: glycogen debranching protein GlgX [Actinomyces sp.]|nr:glycogen debranching protein GlgX [Actinomyces sp.]